MDHIDCSGCKRTVCCQCVFSYLCQISFKPLYPLKMVKKALYGDRRFFSVILYASFFIFLLDASLVDLLLRLSVFPLAFWRCISFFRLLIFSLYSTVIVRWRQMYDFYNDVNGSQLAKMIKYIPYMSLS